MFHSTILSCLASAMIIIAYAYIQKNTSYRATANGRISEPGSDNQILDYSRIGGGCDTETAQCRIFSGVIV